MARCTVTQIDSRTIRVQADGGSFRIPYVFFWDGHEREPESVALSAGKGESAVRAFFLFGTIEDTIRGSAQGVTVDRKWTVRSTGSVRLTIDLDIELPAPSAVLFPAVAAVLPGPSPAAVPGERTSYPLAAFVRGGRAEALAWSQESRLHGERASIGASVADRDEGAPAVRLRVQAPGAGGPVEDVIQAQGDLAVAHRVCVVFSPAGEIQVRGTAAVLARTPAQEQPPADGKPTVDRDRLREALSACLSTHLRQAGGVAGLREVPGSTRLSVSAGLAAAVLARRLFPGDSRMDELSRRLADFALKGQHPSGLFFTAWDEKAGDWAGVRGKPRQPLLSIGDAARSADSLLAFAEDLAAEGLPHEKYWLAGLRFVEFFIDAKARLVAPGSLHLPDERAPAEQGLGGLALFTPLARVYGRTRKDRHRKPLDELVRGFSALAWDPFSPPSLREGRGADAEAALLAARLFVEMRAAGYRPVEPTGGTPTVQKRRAAQATVLFGSLLLPWIRLHPQRDDGGKGADVGGSGMLVESFARQRLVPACTEAAWILLALREQSPDPDLKSLLRGTARLCLQASADLPLGTSWLQHTEWGGPQGAQGERGPVDSRRLVREAWFGLRLLEDFPRL